MVDSRSCQVSGTQGPLNSFPATLLAFSNIVSDCVSGCICSLPGCRSIWQSNRVDWLVSFFSKMTNIVRQCPFRDSFPAGAKMPCSPTNQIAAWTCGTAPSPRQHLNARQIITTPTIDACAHAHYMHYPRPLGMGGKQLLALQLWRSFLCVFSLLMCLPYLQTMWVNLVWYLWVA